MSESAIVVGMVKVSDILMAAKCAMDSKNVSFIDPKMCVLIDNVRGVIVSTDGFTMVNIPFESYHTDKLPRDIILTPKTISEIKRDFKRGEKVEVSVKLRHIFIVGKGKCLTVDMNGRDIVYPDYTCIHVNDKPTWNEFSLVDCGRREIVVYGKNAYRVFGTETTRKTDYDGYVEFALGWKVVKNLKAIFSKTDKLKIFIRDAHSTIVASNGKHAAWFMPMRMPKNEFRS